jgi:hypothetical protein
MLIYKKKTGEALVKYTSPGGGNASPGSHTDFVVKAVIL